MANGRGASAGADSVLVVVPTYDERENLEPVLRRVLTAVPEAHVLVVDDDSPDGTGDLADELAAADARVHVLHRTDKAGLGAAYVAGFEWAMRRGYDVLVEMDADGSHAPEDLPRLLGALGEGSDPPHVVVGSRYVPGGRVVNWPWHRQMLSRGANVYSKVALGVPVNDITAGFRVYRADVLAALNLDSIASQGYCFQVDLTWRAVEAGYTVVELPITFVDREAGESKMSGSIVREALVRVTKWGVRRRGNQAWHAVRSVLR
ncbi:polyprenol monophosphomannose synthase [Saccharopolyspora sp. HNM0983]|uniref:Polyprenol monophosphomannose synthase n=1 Tax=Saccharopolyspora montiporae TaxID=2781240 RepID=A0A929BDN2_9PSEU|nr:polyprenol monophosphomannose synthase [Saccharopolyspora sp. HNM0983]MBE9376450.1 polyprenol monophosphomannose synthase [Saccharopolyspora sp. HNM0983]